MYYTLNDNRYELIGKYKKKLIESTNIETSEDEMKVIDNILFRMWQMGWLDRLEKQEPKKPYSNNIDARMLCPTCKKQLRTFLNTEDELLVPCRVSHFPEYCEWCGQAIDWSEDK